MNPMVREPVIQRLSPWDTHIWHISFQQLQPVIDMSKGFEHLLGEVELARADSIKVTRNRAIYILAKMLVRRVLSYYCAIPAANLQFAENPFGKPFLVDAHGNACGPQFNLSHCSNCIVLAISSEAAVGIDVECYQPALKRDIAGIADRFFTPHEQAFIASFDTSLQTEDPFGTIQKSQIESFLRLWTLKEAWVKCAGQGLSMSLNNIEFRLGASQTVSECDEGDGPSRSLPHAMQFYQWSDTFGNHFALCRDICKLNCHTDSREERASISFFTLDSYWQYSQREFHYQKVNAFSLPDALS